MSLASIALAAACLEAGAVPPSGNGSAVHSPNGSNCSVSQDLRYFQEHAQNQTPQLPLVQQGQTAITAVPLSPSHDRRHFGAIGLAGLNGQSHLAQLSSIAQPEAGASRVVSVSDEKDLYFANSKTCRERKNSVASTESDESCLARGVVSVSVERCNSRGGKSSAEGSGSIAVGEHDVLCGRGGETNHHPGNVYYRKLVKSMQREYLDAMRRDKPRIARGIVEMIRTRNPPGRFLKRDGGGAGRWYEIGLNKAREKTSQALREGAPEIRVASTVSTPPDVHPGVISPPPSAPAVAAISSPSTPAPVLLSLPGNNQGTRTSLRTTVVSSTSSSSDNEDETSSCLPSQPQASFVPAHWWNVQGSDTVLATSSPGEESDENRNAGAKTGSSHSYEESRLRRKRNRGPRLYLFKSRCSTMMEEAGRGSTELEIPQSKRQRVMHVIGDC